MGEAVTDGPEITGSEAGSLFTVRGEKDDLTRIQGIGPVLEQRLSELGITTFQQIASFTKEDTERVSANLKAFRGRIIRDDWIGKAKREYEKKYGKPI
jgi:predicted flap endonuclease-1-like 5' DNA nuclease